MKKIFYRVLSVMLCLVVVLMPTHSTVFAADGVAGNAALAAIPAFPGAEGFGAYVTGGRGGEVYHVTTLANAGAGSFREAVTTGTAPRTVVFDVYGYIELTSPIKTNRSNLTIAGQTAPGEGVTVRGNSVTFEDASNIILRNMRFRSGVLKDTGGGTDAVYFHYCNGVIIDHCSFSWGSDESLSIKESRNVTTQWSMITEGFLPHSMGSLIEWNTITMHHNLYAHNNDRNPKAKGDIDFVNNVVYDWGVSPLVAGGETAGWCYMNADSNYFISGASTVKNNFGIDRGNAQFSLYLNNNLFDNNRDGALNGIDVGRNIIEEGTSPVTLASTRYDYPRVNTEDALSAFHHVVEKAGASLKRDAIDTRVMNGVKNQTGTLILTSDEVGGYCELAGGITPLDTDGDGMPDVWEDAQGLNKEDVADGAKDRNGDGYTNLEDYLNHLVVSEFPNSQIPPTLNGPPANPEVVNYKFDFGADSSQVAEGYTRVSGISLYSAAAGYGFDGVRGLVTTADRGAPNPLEQDFCYPATSGKTIAFAVDVPKGRHYVSIISGDSTNANETTISLENGVAGDILKSDKGSFAKKTWYVDVEDGQLNITLGKDARINGLEVCTVPSNLIRGSVSDTQAQFSWSPVKTTVRYEVYRAVEADGTYAFIGSSMAPEYSDAAVMPGETYYYKVSAITNTTVTVPSEILSISVVNSEVAIPKVPTGLAVEGVTPATVTLGWDRVEGALRYNIYRSDKQEGDYRRVGSSHTNTFIDPIKTDLNYFYKVTAVNAGGESEKTAAVLSGKGSVPGVPTGLKLHYAAAAGISLHWTASGEAENYNIYRASVQGPVYERVGTSEAPNFVDKTVTTSTYYSYRISSVNSAGESDLSESILVECRPLEYKFDFGMQTSPVADGYIQIYGANVYNSQYGFNDISGISARDRTKSPSPVNDYVLRDFLVAKGKNFLVDVPNGYYSVSVASGDGNAVNVTTITVENGEAKVFKTAAGIIPWENWIIQVEDGQITVNIGGDGRINGLIIEELPN